MQSGMLSMRTWAGGGVTAVLLLVCCLGPKQLCAWCRESEPGCGHGACIRTYDYEAKNCMCCVPRVPQICLTGDNHPFDGIGCICSCTKGPTGPELPGVPYLLTQAHSNHAEYLPTSHAILHSVRPGTNRSALCPLFDFLPIIHSLGCWCTWECVVRRGLYASHHHNSMLPYAGPLSLVGCELTVCCPVWQGVSSNLKPNE